MRPHCTPHERRATTTVGRGATAARRDGDARRTGRRARRVDDATTREKRRPIGLDAFAPS